MHKASMNSATVTRSNSSKRGRSGTIGGLYERLRSLRVRHRQLETNIGEEMLRPMPDILIVQKLKRLRLRIRDEIEILGGVLRTVDRPPLAETAAS